MIVFHASLWRTAFVLLVIGACLATFAATMHDAFGWL